MAAIKFSLIFTLAAFAAACVNSEASQTNSNPATPTPSPFANRPARVATSFAYPVGTTETVTQKKDRDDWYNALEFGETDHLGEDWNKNTGGNTDCGEPVYVMSDGRITYAQDAGPGWGNVVIVEHLLPNGEKVESLYGHMQEILKTEGEVRKREQIGKIGNANGKYLCHLHFEVRTSDCPIWNVPGPGYSRDRTGWIDPSDFIDEKRRKDVRP